MPTLKRTLRVAGAAAGGAAGGLLAGLLTAALAWSAEEDMAGRKSQGKKGRKAQTKGGRQLSGVGALDQPSRSLMREWQPTVQSEVHKLGVFE